MEQAEASLPADKTALRIFSRELKDAFADRRWMFPRLDLGQNPAGGFQAKVFKRWEDEGVATLERVAVGWRVVMRDNTAMIFGTAWGAASWLHKECEQKELRGE